MTNEDLLTKAKKYRWIIFWTLSFGYLLVYFHRLCPAVVAVDMMRDLNATGALTGFLGAAYFYPYAAMQLPAGLLSDSWGPRNTITLFFIIALAGSVILGLAPTVFIAILGRTMVGLGVAMLFVPTMKILAEWFHAKEFAAHDRHPHGHRRTGFTCCCNPPGVAQQLDRVAHVVYCRGCLHPGSGCPGLDHCPGSAGGHGLALAVCRTFPNRPAVHSAV